MGVEPQPLPGAKGEPEESLRSGSLQAAQQQVEGLQLKLGEAESAEADVSSRLLQEADRLAESVSGHDELQRRLESSDGGLEHVHV